MINYYKGNIEPGNNIVFVFGSNPIGINGNRRKRTGGAALVAVEKFGVGEHEVMNNCLSKSGRAYGLVTVVAPGRKRSISKDQLFRNVCKLYNLAWENPELKFMVAYRNVDTPSLSGYTGREMMRIFSGAKIPPNVYFSEEWYKSGELKQTVDSINSIYSLSF